MTIGTPGEIAALKARISELQGMLSSTHCSSARDWASGVTTSTAVIEQRRASTEQVQTEIKAAQAHLLELKKLRPHECIGWTSLLAGCITGITLFVVAGAKDTPYATGLDTLAALAGGAAAVTTVAVGASNTRWRGRRGLG